MKKVKLIQDDAFFLTPSYGNLNSNPGKYIFILTVSRVLNWTEVISLFK